MVATTAPSPRISTRSASLTELLAEAICSVDPSSIDPETTLAAQKYVLDWLACAVAGTSTPTGEILTTDASMSSAGPADVLGLNEGRDAHVAAFTNGGLSHIAEMDDIDRGSVVHPGTVVIPAALAAAQDVGANGLEFLTAVIVGYEVAIRVGEAVGRSHYHFWQNTATCGTFGATAAAGRLYNLTQEQMVWALGSAGSMAAGLWQFKHDGAMTKSLHTAQAAANGVRASRLARLGFTGAREILEGPQGFFTAMSDDYVPGKVTGGLDAGLGTNESPWKIHGVSLKPYASCRHTHAAVDAALSLRQALGQLTPEEVRVVRVGTYAAAVAITDDPSPHTAYQAKFSMQFCVAQALLTGHLGPHDFESTQIDDPLTRQLITKVVLSVDPELDTRYPAAWCARVAVETLDGRIKDHLIEAPKGDPERQLSQADLEVKARDLAQGTAFDESTAAMIDAVTSLPNRGSMLEFLPRL
ncbi:MAG: MmgE/PrpD family protein [Chloroflexota bacterium]|nr:MmgE/PrpD family protein [Chloroflexota bacterium]